MSPETRKNAVRWGVFALVAAVVMISLSRGGVSRFPATPVVRAVYDEVEKLPAGSPILVSSDFDPGSEAELKPMMKAILAQCFRKKLRVVVMSICSPNSPPLADEIATEAAEAAGAKYGEDYAVFGYAPGASAPILALGQDWSAVYRKDRRDTPLADLPVMRGITKLTDFPYCLEISAVNTVEYWILAGNAKYGLKIGLGTTAVQAPDYYQYLATKQVTGIVGGIAGAAQYEHLALEAEVNAAREGRRPPGDLASARMPTQSALHVTVVLLILAGNTLYFLSRRRAKP